MKGDIIYGIIVGFLIGLLFSVLFIATAFSIEEKKKIAETENEK